MGYQVVGSGPVDLVFVPHDYSNIEAAWEFPPFVTFVRGLASIGRVLIFDRRGSGTSDRSWTGEAATIEARMDDIRAVMDAGSANPRPLPHSVGSSSEGLSGALDAKATGL